VYDQVSATWFGEGERTTATGIISSANSLAAVVTFMVFPSTVHDAADVPLMQVRGLVQG